MPEGILSAIPFGILLSITVGPVFFVLLETSATKGFKAALYFDFGVIIADILFLVIAFFSTNTLIESIKKDSNFLLIGGFLMLGYGIFSLIKTIKSYRLIIKEFYDTEVKTNFFQLFFKGFFLNFVNIGVLIGWVGFIVIANTLMSTKVGVIYFLAFMLLSYLATDLIKIVIAKQIKRRLNPKRIILLKKIISYVIIGFGFLLVVQVFFPEAKESLQNYLDI